MAFATRNRWVLFCFLLGRSGFAEKEAGTITFLGPEAECPTPAYVDERIGRLLGSGVHGSGMARVLVTRSQSGYDAVVSIETEKGRGERRFSANSCQLAADTAALIVAISLFPERAGELTSRANDLDAEVPQPRAPSANSGVTRPSRSFAFLAAAGGDLDTSSLPFTALGPGGSFGLRVETHFVVEMFAEVFLRQTVHQTETRSAQFDMLSGGLRGCYVVARGALGGGPCIGAKAVRLAGQGEGTDRTYRGVGLYVGPSVGALFRWTPGGPFGLRVCAELFSPLTRRPFLLDGAEIHRPPSLGASAFVGPELSF